MTAVPYLWCAWHITYKLGVRENHPFGCDMGGVGGCQAGWPPPLLFKWPNVLW